MDSRKAPEEWLQTERGSSRLSSAPSPFSFSRLIMATSGESEAGKTAAAPRALGVSLITMTSTSTGLNSCPGAQSGPSPAPCLAGTRYYYASGGHLFPPSGSVKLPGRAEGGQLGMELGEEG